MAKLVATAQRAPAVSKAVGVSAVVEETAPPLVTVHPELVEGSSFCSGGDKEGQGFDKLSPNGSDDSGPTIRDPKGRFLPRSGPAKPRSAKKKPKAPARQRWTARAEAVFLEALAETGNVAHAARTAKLSDTTVYRQRRKSEAFRIKWAEALREGYAKLEADVLDRALNGVEKPVFHGGQQVAMTRTFNDNLAMQLIRQHRDAVHGGMPTQVSDLSEEQLRALVSAQLSEANRRMGGQG